MGKTLVLLFIVCLSSCFCKTSRDLPRIEEAIENFQKHRQKLEEIRDLVLSNSKYELSGELEDLLEESNCQKVTKHGNDVVLITYFHGGTILSSSYLYYMYMEPFYPSYGDTIPIFLNLREEEYRKKLKGNKLKSLGGGWYLRLL